MTEIRDDLQAQREHLLELADRDAEVVDELFGTASGDVGQTVVKRSIGIPLTTAEACLTVMESGTVVIEEADRIAAADVMTGTFLTRSALQASVFTVRSNLPTGDPSFDETVERRIAAIETSAEAAFEEAASTVDEDR